MLAVSKFDDSDRQAELLSRIPMNSIGNADEIAYGVLYLASDESSFVAAISDLVAMSDEPITEQDLTALARQYRPAEVQMEAFTE